MSCSKRLIRLIVFCLESASTGSHPMRDSLQKDSIDDLQIYRYSRALVHDFSLCFLLHKGLLMSTAKETGDDRPPLSQRGKLG